MSPYTLAIIIAVISFGFGWSIGYANGRWVGVKVGRRQARKEIGE